MDTASLLLHFLAGNDLVVVHASIPGTVTLVVGVEKARVLVWLCGEATYRREKRIFAR